MEGEAVMPCVVRWAEPDDEVVAAATRGVGKSEFLAGRRRIERLVEMIRAIVRVEMRPGDQQL